MFEFAFLESPRRCADRNFSELGISDSMFLRTWGARLALLYATDALCFTARVKQVPVKMPNGEP